ncbi:MAG: GDP-4-dehydro-6-deoxy-D-mannose reductase [Actinomycetota bacterium]|jgi:GDP-4-dehydro-6-deoxy-D-mannose reductase|nr:GDP-4-dehydro-6-deoxy-D-mannose reductase [Actinomycetota bacterium]
MKVLVTGAGGFVGGHLVPSLRDDGHEVVGTGLSEADDLRYLDVRDPKMVNAIVEHVKPDLVFHLAGQSSVSLSWRDPALTYEVNAIGTHYLLDALHRHVPNCRVHIAASSDEYGRVPPEDCPLDESAPLRPVSPYAVSRVAGEWIARMYYESFGLHAVVTRAFMHIGPGQPPSFATADWAQQIAMAEAGQREPVVRTGALEGMREFGDVRDVVRAYRAILELGDPGDAYNVATGEPHRLGDVLDLLIGMSKVTIEVATDPAKIRPVDFPVLYGDASKLEAKTGWKPEYRLEDTLADLLDHWREVVASA